MASWSASGGVVRLVALSGMPALEIAFFRALLGTLIMVPWLVALRINPLPRRRFGLHAGRGLVELAAMGCWFTAIAAMPLAEVVALGFTAPLFATLLGALFLGERLRLRRSVAIAIGLAGAIVILRPGFQSVTAAAFLALAAALASAGSRVIARELSKTESTVVILASFGFFTTPAMAVAASFVWQTPSLGQFGWMCLIAVLAALGHYCITRSLRLCEASEVAPYEFAQMIVAVAFGYWVFGESPDLWTWVGSVIIAATAVYVMRRESLLRRARAAAEAADGRGA